MRSGIARVAEVCTVDVKGSALLNWARRERGWIDESIQNHGVALIRGAPPVPDAEFEAVAEAVCAPLVDYVYRSTPRTAVGRKVFTATEYPANRSIPLHNENAFQRRWPMRLAFYCARPAATKGATTLAYTSKVTDRIGSRIFDRFASRGVRYVRHYHPGIDLPWQEVFQTDAKQELEDFCRDAGIDTAWTEGGVLRTSQKCQGVAAHPDSGEVLWFNQAHLFHGAALGQSAFNAALRAFGERLPRHAQYGDGEEIDTETLSVIGGSYEAEKSAHEWTIGDLLVLDNMRVAHGREDFTGERRLLSAMGREHSG